MFLDTATMKIDRSEFELVPEARHTTSAGALNIRASGEIILNKRLLQNILRRTDSLRLGFACHKEDKGLLLLFVTDKPNYTFPAGGMKKDTYFTRSLVENGISLPARISWSGTKRPMPGWACCRASGKRMPCRPR